MTLSLQHTIYPGFDDFKNLYFEKGYNLIPVWSEVLADFLTPLSCFDRVASDSSNVALLESVEGGERWGRYSFIIVSPSEIIRCENSDESPLEYLKKYLKDARPATGIKGLPRFWGGAVGYISYDFVRRIENIKIDTADHSVKDDLGLPESVFLIANTLIIFDHLLHTIKVVYVCDLRGNDKHGLSAKRIKVTQLKKIYNDAARKIHSIIYKISMPRPLQIGTSPLGDRSGHSYGVKFESNFTKQKFIKSVLKAKKYILEGDIIQVVLSQRFQTTSKQEISPFDVYRALRMTNPSPYMYYFKFKDFCISGSSPEILVRKEDNIAITKPIAGTRHRGANLEEDKSLAEELLSDPKERAEHVMLVDLGRNDLARVCQEGSVKVDEFMRVEKYSHVMHMVSTVSGKMKKGEDAFSLFKACFPAGTVTGAPKVRAMQIIEELEPSRRGIYAGAVGYFSYDGNMDMAITIRTIIFKKNFAYIQAGAGIVADSVPGKEYEETLNKARALFVSIGLSKSISTQPSYIKNGK